MRALHINLPLLKMRRLFALFDADESGTIDHEEFCRLLFPAAASEMLDATPVESRRSGSEHQSQVIEYSLDIIELRERKIEDFGRFASE